MNFKNAQLMLKIDKRIKQMKVLDDAEKKRVLQNKFYCAYNIGLEIFLYYFYKISLQKSYNII